MEFNHPVGDYHVHPDFSIDAKGTLREYCDKAVEIGLSEIVFTTHVDSNPYYSKDNFMVIDGEKVPFSPDSLKRYRDDVYELISGNDPMPITIKCGVEVEYFPGIKDSFLQMVAEQHFDFILCGIHFIEEHLISSEKQMIALLDKYSPDELMRKYYEIVCQACEIDIYDSHAHLDSYRRFGMKLFPKEAARVDYPFIDQALDKLARCRLPIEVNTSGIRHGIGDWYPSKPLLQKARKAGVLIGGLGSDAHSPEQLAVDFDMAHLIVYETFPAIYED
jgi:histidinol-phosphatase (PHP family)